MSNTAIALLGYVGLFSALLLIMAGLRTYVTLVGKKPANSFSPSGEDVSPFSARLCRVHANAYEFFPMAGGLLLYALATGQTAVTNGLALLFLGGRVMQALTHLLSSSILAVQVRFFFFLVQFFIGGWWLLQFTGIL